MTEREHFDLVLIELRERLIHAFRRREFLFIKEQCGRDIGHAPNADFKSSYFLQINLKLEDLK